MYYVSTTKTNVKPLTWHHTIYRNHIKPTITMSAYIHYNQDYSLLICKVHQCTVSSKFLARHFFEEHKLDIKVRQDIINYASQFATVKPSEVGYPTEKITPIPYIKIITGFQCQYECCGKVLGTLVSIKGHCKVEHDWKAKDGEK